MVILKPKFEFRKGFVKVFAAFELPLNSHFVPSPSGFKAFPLRPYLLSLKVSNLLWLKFPFVWSRRCLCPAGVLDPKEIPFLERDVFHRDEGIEKVPRSARRPGPELMGMGSTAPGFLDHFLPESHFNSVSMLQPNRALRAESTLSAQSSARLQPSKSVKTEMRKYSEGDEGNGETMLMEVLKSEKVR